MLNTDKYPCEMKLTCDQAATPFIVKVEDGSFIAAFYRLFVNLAYHAKWEEIENLDCRKIIVSTDISEGWYTNLPDITEEQFTMILLANGPKSDPSLPPKTVRWANDCVRLK